MAPWPTSATEPSGESRSKARGVPPNANTAYWGLGERAGHFVATATAAGYRPNSVTGDIDRDSCHVITQTVEIQLAPN